MKRYSISFRYSKDGSSCFLHIDPGVQSAFVFTLKLNAQSACSALH